MDIVLIVLFGAAVALFAVVRSLSFRRSANRSSAPPGKDRTEIGRTARTQPQSKDQGEADENEDPTTWDGAFESCDRGLTGIGLEDHEGNNGGDDATADYNHVDYQEYRLGSASVDVGTGDVVGPPRNSVPEHAPGAAFVECTAFSRCAVRPLQAFIVQAAVHLPTQRNAVEQLAKRTDPSTDWRATHKFRLSAGQSVVITLEIKGATVADGIREVPWNGDISFAYFDVQAPESGFGELLAIMGLSVSGIPIGRCSWIVREVEQDDSSTLAAQFRSYRRAFLSYSSHDRIPVLNFAQLLRALRIEFFQDLLSLEPGERFGDVIEGELQVCDLFVLFWSSHARDSEWVIREAMLASARRDKSSGGVPDFRVVLLEGPPPPMPPPSLQSIVHLNDYIRYVIAAHETAAGRIRTGAGSSPNAPEEYR